MDELVIGIDEAGRGPILGPMVMACVALGPAEAAALKRAGVMDSKAFGSGDKAHGLRCQLVPQIMASSRFACVEVVEVAEIDRRTRLGELNRLEQERAAAMLALAPPCDRIVADGQRLFAPLVRDYPHLQAVNGGEAQHVSVAAASILAKVRRDEIYHKICRRYEGEFGDLVWRGGGYLNAATQRFLRAYCERYRSRPPEGRQSWPWDFAADLLDAPPPPNRRGVGRRKAPPKGADRQGSLGLD